MSIAFIYLWRDKSRNMYYIGSHVGTLDDGYLTSSDWLNGEIRYRPKDFKRRILKIVDENELRVVEYALIKKIKPEEFRARYYNLKQGRDKGCIPANKGKKHTEEARAKMRAANKGLKRPWIAGTNLKARKISAENGKKSAHKITETIKGRKLITFNGERKWAYPEDDKWFVKKDGMKIYVHPANL